MATDLFANPSRDYVYPTISPCANNSGSEANLEFVKDGIGIVSGQDVISKIDFSNISIPVNSYSNESKILKPGEITYINGLTKGLTKRTQVFNIPNLVSTNPDSNDLFFTLDLSLAYYSNFSYTVKNIEASSNYGDNITLDVALNIILGDLGTKITATLDASYLTLSSVQDGYHFEAQNAILGIIDSSINVDSVFTHLANADEYVLPENLALKVEYANYPNGAMQGIIMKGLYPAETGGCGEIAGSPNNFLFINHTKDFITVYEPVEVYYDSEVSTGLRVYFDPSTFIGNKPYLNYDFSIGSYTFNFDISLNTIIIMIGALADPSTDISDLTIDNSVLQYYNIMSSMISDSSLSYNNIFESSINTSYALRNYIVDTLIIDSELDEIGADISDIFGSNISDSSIIGSIINDSSINNLAPSDYLAYYDFNNNIIGIADVSPNTWVPTYVAGVDGSALHLDGSVILYPGFVNPTDFTVSFWVKNGVHLTPNVIFEMASATVPQDINIRIIISNTDLISVYIENNPAGELSTSHSIASGYHFIILTKSSGNYSLYVDDTQISKWDSALSIQPNVSGNLNSIGSDALGYDKIIADIDEFRIYNRALSATERQLIKDNTILINPSFINNSNVGASKVLNSDAVNSYFIDNSIYRSYLNRSTILNSVLIDVSVNTSNLENSYISNANLGDVSIYLSTLIDVSALNSYIKDSSISNCISESNIIYKTNIVNLESINDTINISEIINAYIDESYLNDVSISNAFIIDCSMMNIEVANSSLLYLYAEDSSITNCVLINDRFKNTDVKDSSMDQCATVSTIFNNTFITDSSITDFSIINNNSVIRNSIIINSYTNTHKLLIYTDPSTGQNYYSYITKDNTLGIDSSLQRVSIYETLIWDSSINNAIIYDSSIYNSLIEDSSLVRCTTYNCTFDPLTYFEDTRDILVDPSIDAAYIITHDTSIFYIKKIKRLEVGMSGCSSDSVMSAGDYLKWVTDNNYWNKFSEMYIWTSSIDCPECPTCRNLINGFYVYNPQTFDIKIEYMVFV